MKTENLKEVRFSTKVLIVAIVWFNIPFLFAIANLEVPEFDFWNIHTGLFQFWLTYNFVLLGIILGVEKPKASAGFIAIANEFVDMGRKVLGAFKSVDAVAGLLKDKTLIDAFSDPKTEKKPEPLPLEKKEKIEEIKPL